MAVAIISVSPIKKYQYCVRRHKLSNGKTNQTKKEGKAKHLISNQVSNI
jgi:hypothetical protein